jgi:Aerotolerance regulator N-terminal/von Willebrand factor type A domain
MLSFLAPLFLFGAVAAALPIVLHLLKREPEARIKFAAVKLLKQAPVEHTEKRHIRELLLLALRIGALVLLAFAFARPFLPSRAAASAGGVTVVALDTSFSLAAPGRFERARQLARDAVHGAPAGDLVGLVTFSDTADIVVKPSADRVLATGAIEQAAVGFGGTRYRAALSAAAQAAGGRSSTVVVVTDLQENGWDAGDRVSVPDGTTISVVDVGAPPPNLAVTGVRPQPDRVIATVHNASARATDARVHLTIDNRPVADATVSLGPNQSSDVPLAAALRGESVAVTVDDPTGIQADNIRYAVLGGTVKPTVLVVSGSGDLSRDAFYVQQALAVGAGPSGGYQPVGISGGQLSAAGDDRLAVHAAVLLLSTRGLERRGRETLAAYVRAGGGILIAAGPDVDGDVVRDVLGGSSALQMAPSTDMKREVRALAPADVRHPVFTAFAGNSGSLGLVTFTRVARIGGSACQTLARFTTGDVALAECPAGDGRALMLASDLDNRWNDFPLRATFVPFLHEVVRYVASARTHASDYVVADAPAGVPRQPGIATVPGGRPGVPPRRIAVNVDPRESDPARLSTDDFQSAVTRLKDAAPSEARIEAREQEDRQHMWQFLILAMVLMLVVEGMVASRTA